MSDYRTEVVITLITKRPPPVRTFENYPPPSDMTTIVIADPDVYEEHREFAAGVAGVIVVKGVRGMGQQSAECYKVAAAHGFPYFFRLDDDLTPKTFVHKEGHYPELAEVIEEAYNCLKETGVTLAGFMNTSNRYWMGEGYGKTYGLITGGANISVSAADPSEFIDPEVIVEDVYRTCAHRTHDFKINGKPGYVGRVKHIGMDKRSITVTAGQTSISVTAEARERDRQMILERFPTMVSCEGTRWINNDKDEIVNWKLHRRRKA